MTRAARQPTLSGVSDEALFRIRTPEGVTYGPADRATLLVWAREGRVPLDAELVPDAGGGPPVSVRDDPELALHAAAPPTIRPAATSQAAPAGSVPPDAAPAPASADAPLSGLVPYRNLPALIAYYLALLSLLPFVGIVTGLAALVLGIVGLQLRGREPSRKGSVHAWIGVVGGGGLALIWLIMLLMIGLHS